MAGKWVYDGTTWQPANAPATTPAPTVQDFTSSGTWVNPDDGWVRGVCELIGGGQGGGSSPDTVGRGGAYALFIFTPANVSLTESVTVGAGGLKDKSPGDPGGDTLFSALPFLVGKGGNSANPNAPIFGEASKTTTDSNFAAGTGVNTGTRLMGGVLADSFGLLKAGDGGAVVSNVAQDGTAPGGGGGMASGWNSRGNGAPGRARITLYYA